jgi:hypothetical protein
MNKKQTAVEYLLISLLNKFPKEMEYLFSLNNTLIQDTFNEAKEIEREQIINSFKEGTKFIDINDEISAEFNGIIYYNETFNN